MRNLLGWLEIGPAQNIRNYVPATTTRSCVPTGVEQHLWAGAGK